MTPTICDHAECSARAAVFTTFTTGHLIFCCHHWSVLRAALADRTTAVRVDATCRRDLAVTIDDPGTDGRWPALAA